MLLFFQNRRKRSGQSLIEYALLITLMLAGVLVMGPYVIRSWQANVKGWDDSYKDSFQDPITASPPAGFDVGCTCTPDVVPCATPPCCGFGSCLETQDSELFICSPTKCGTGSDTCTDNPNCCSEFIPLPTPGECGNHGCAADEVLYVRYCGSDDPTSTSLYTNSGPPTRFECRQNANCLFSCLNPPDPIADPQYAPAGCLQDDVGLTINTNVTFVDPGGCSIPVGSAPKCQWECTGAFVPGFSSTSCECPTGSLNDGGNCIIDCGISEGDCQDKTSPNPPPIPNSCADLNAAECALYDGACRWSPSGCQTVRQCNEFVTNVTLTAPLSPNFARCEYHPWCEWIGGGGYCCSAVQHGTCAPGLAEDIGCGVGEVQGCCQGPAIALGTGGGGGSCSRAINCASASGAVQCGTFAGCVWVPIGAGFCQQSDPCTYGTAASCAAGAGCIWS